jgi:hypothetical protein
MVINLITEEKKPLPNEILERIRAYTPIDGNTANVIVLSVLQVLAEHGIKCSVKAPT